MAPQWLDEREARTWQGFQRLYRRLDTELARQLADESQMLLADYEVLVVLTAHPDGLRGFELAEQLGWDKTRLSHRIKAMVADGLVRKRPCPADGRGYEVAATAKGRRAIAAAAPGHVAAVRRLFIDLLSARELDVVGDVTARALAALDAPERHTRPQSVVRGTNT